MLFSWGFTFFHYSVRLLLLGREEEGGVVCGPTLLLLFCLYLMVLIYLKS